MTERVVISHIAALLPDGEDAVARGERAIQAVMHGVRHVRGLGEDSATRVGSRITSRVEDPRIPAHVDSQLTRSSRYAVMAGLDLLANAGLISAERGWELAEDERDCTGIIFASSFEHHEASLRSTRYAARRDELARVREALADIPEASPRLDALEAGLENEGGADVRKVALQLLLGANVQLAQIVKARGLNTFVTCACASTTAALSLASAVMRAGEVRRCVVVACDTLLQPDAQVVAESFVRLRAATTATCVDEAVRPFGHGRNGFVLGDGAVALLLERGVAAASTQDLARASPRARVEILASRLANSAYHGTRLDATHLAHVLDGCVREACDRRGGISFEDLAARSVYVSHETFTPACASAEISALETVFGREGVRALTIASTKGSTGHMMGAGMEDVVSVEALRTSTLPNTRIQNVDPAFSDLTFASGGKASFDFAIHLAAGMGSHVAVVIYAVLA